MSPSNFNPLDFNPNLEELTEVKVDRIFDLSYFRCEEKELSDYLLEDAFNHYRDKISVTYLLLRDNLCIGYYTICNDSIRKQNMDSYDKIEGIDFRYYPAVKIAKLARDIKYKGQSIGFELMIRAIEKATAISEVSGCRLITVDAKKHENVIEFYESFGFKRAKKQSGNSDSISMYLDYVKANI